MRLETALHENVRARIIKGRVEVKWLPTLIAAM